MPRPLGPAFNGHAVRDALGLLRLLFAIEREGTDLDRTTALPEVGKALSDCLSMLRGAPETLCYRAAVSRSADAVDKLAAMTSPAHVADLVCHARGRVKGDQDRKLDQRDAKKAGRWGVSDRRGRGTGDGARVRARRAAGESAPARACAGGADRFLRMAARTRVSCAG